MRGRRPVGSICDCTLTIDDPLPCREVTPAGVDRTVDTTAPDIVSRDPRVTTSA